MPSFPSHLQGLNTFQTAGPGSFGAGGEGFSDADLAETLALWTNVEFSFDDGGVGLGSGLKLVEEDERLAREAAAVGHPHWESTANTAALAPAPGTLQEQTQQQQLEHALQQPAVGQAQDALDPFGFNATFFALPSAVNLAPVANGAPAPSAAAPTPASVTSKAALTLETFDFSALPGYPGAASVNEVLATAPVSAGLKRKLSVSASARPSPGSFEDESGSHKSPSALSAEEDKRRRNTEASARFRAKKKEREAALEKSSRELQARTAALEKEVETLRRENTWLKGLVIAGEGAKTASA